MDFSNGDITFSGNTATFTVTQNVHWSGGRFRPRVNILQSGTRDTWLMGSLLVAANYSPVIAPVTLNYTAGLPVDTTFKWLVIKINGPITMQGGGVVQPIIQSDGPNYHRFSDTPQPGVTEWFLGVP